MLAAANICAFFLPLVVGHELCIDEVVTLAKKLIVGKTLYPFGDTNELLFKEAIQQITGKQKKKRTSYTMVEDDYLYLKPFLNMKKVKGLIDDYDNLE